MTTTHKANQAAWIVVALLWFVAMLNYFDRQLIVTMGQPIKAELNIGDAYFGLFSSVFLWVYAFCSLIAGFIADRFGYRRAILLSLTIWSIATFFTGFAKSFQAMLLARAVMGISEAFYVPAALAMIVEYHRGRTRSLATGLHISGMYFGSVLGGLGGWIAESFGWRLGFQLFGAIGVGYALFLMVMLKNPPQVCDEVPPCGKGRKPAFGDAFRTLLSSRGFRRLLGVCVCSGAGFWTVKNWMPTFFNMELGVDLTLAGLYGTAVFNTAAFVGMLTAGILSDRLAVRNLRARMIIPAVGYCIAAPWLFGIGIVSTVPIVFAAIVILGMTQGALDTNLMPALCTIADSPYRATGYGMLNFVGTLAGGVMTFIGGWLKDSQISFTTTFQFTSAFILVAGLLLFTVKPKRH
jgi:MFS family permease